MQPPRPFRGASYDKDMFTFLPAPSNKDAVFPESSRKRKFISSDHQFPRHGFEMSDPKLNSSEWRGKVHKTSAPTFPPEESLHSRNYPPRNQYWDQPNYVASGESNKRVLRETRSEYTGSSFSRQLDSPIQKDSLSSFHMSEIRTKPSKWDLSVAKDFNQFENNKSTREENAAQFKEFQKFAPNEPVHTKAISSVSHEQTFLNPGASVVGLDGKVCQAHGASAWLPSISEDFGHLGNRQSNIHVAVEEKPVQMNVVAPGSHDQASKNLLESQSLEQLFTNPGASFVGADGKCFPEETYTVESSSNVKQGVGCDVTRLFGNNVGNSVYDLTETNNLLQNALRLLSASGIDLTGSFGGKNQANGDDVKMLNATPDSVNKNVNNSQMKTTLSNNEACSNLDKCGQNSEKSPVKLVKEHKSLNGASTPTENLWDGTLQLSTSVSVSAIAFFKSGEKMQDFSWSESVEVKGKVKLEAFEKYVQDLPRSRTRGLMVMSLCLKEGSSKSSLKGMKEVAKKYKDGKKVGFAQLLSGVDMYICPNCDTIITILAKYGFFKGMTAALDKSDPLLGCVVWRKNLSSVTTTKTAKANDPQSVPSLSSPSDTVAIQVAEENSPVLTQNHEPIILSSEKVQQPTESGEKSRDKSPEFCFVQPKHPSFVPVSDTNTQLSELKTNKEFDKPNQPLPSGVPKQSEVTSDDDDLPEFDFRIAIPQTSTNKPFEGRTSESRLGAEQFRNSHVSEPMLRTESSIILTAPPSLHCQRLVSENIGHQPGSHAQRLPIDPRKQMPELKPDPKIPNFQGLAPNSVPSSKPRNLFDDDDMPEWCPPDFTTTRQNLAQRPGQTIASRHPKAPVSGFNDLAPHLSIPPALTQSQPQDKDYSFSPRIPRALADQPVATDISDRFVGAPPGFEPRPAFRPKFDPPRGRKPIHPSTWRRLRP